MNTTSILPDWLQYMQAGALVAIPFVGVIITWIGVWIAWQQMSIARMKLNHDRYDKRLKIFEAARTLLAEAVTEDKISDATLKPFFVGVVDAPFHFGDDIVRYLDELGTVASSVKVGQQVLKDETDINLREQLKANTKNELLWLQHELQSGVLVNRFRPDLALTPKDAKRG